MTIDRSKLVDKIKALLAKTTANGCTEEEALSALAKARAMIDAYEISDDELALTREEKAIMREDTTHDPHDVKHFLGQAVARFAGVEIWRRSTAYRSRTGTLVFCGLASDCDLAQWLLAHLSQFVLMELTGFLHKNVLPKGARRRVINGFVLGCTQRIAARLDALTRESQRAQVRPVAGAPPNPNTARALVLAHIKRDAIAATKAAAGIHLRSTRTNRKSDHAAANAGRAAGDRATFGRPVAGGPLRIR